MIRAHVQPSKGKQNRYQARHQRLDPSICPIKAADKFELLGARDSGS
jgi:hypothetical protein